MARRRNGIVSGYAEMWPRAVFDIRKGNTIVVWKERVLDKPGVYVLYRHDHPYYVGKTTYSLCDRIWQDANFPKDKWYNLWNYFSAFVVPDKRRIGEIEGILIAAVPTANSARPAILRIDLPLTVRRTLAKLRRQPIEAAMQME